MVTHYFTVLLSRLVCCWVTGEENARLNLLLTSREATSFRSGSSLTQSAFLSALFSFWRTCCTLCRLCPSVLLLRGQWAQSAASELWAAGVMLRHPSPRACCLCHCCAYRAFTFLPRCITAKTHPLWLFSLSLWKKSEPRLPDWTHSLTQGETSGSCSGIWQNHSI